MSKLTTDDLRHLRRYCAAGIVHRVSSALDELTRLRAEIEALRKDKERLDWLESTRGGFEFNDRLVEFTVQRYQQVCGCIGHSRNLRQAIDAAMNQGKDV